MNAVDKFAQIEAEFKAIKKMYEAAKADMIEACMDMCGPDQFKSSIDGDTFKVEFSLTSVSQFSLDRAIELGFITEEEVEASKVSNTRKNLKTSLKSKLVKVPA